MLLPHLPRKGPSLPYGLSSTGISQAAGWRIPSPQLPSEGTAQAVSQGFAQQELKGAGTKTLSHVMSSLSLGPAGIWNRNVPSLLCPGPEPQMEATLSLARALPQALSVRKGHGCPTHASAPLLRVPCSQRSWATHTQAVTAGLAGRKQLGHRSRHCLPRLMLCSLSACSAVPWAGYHAQGRVQCLHNYPDGAGTAPVLMGFMVTGAVRAAWGGGCCQRWTDAPGPSPSCALHCVPGSLQDLVDGDPGGRGSKRHPRHQHAATPPQRGTLVLFFSRGSCPTMAQPVPLLMQCPPANRRGTKSP